MGRIGVVKGLRRERHDLERDSEERKMEEGKEETAGEMGNVGRAQVTGPERRCSTLPEAGGKSSSGRP